VAENCPDRSALAALARGIPQPSEEVERMERHLGGCQACRDALDAFCGAVIGSLELSRLQGEAPPAVEPGVVSKIVRNLENDGIGGIGAGGVVGTGGGAPSYVDPLTILEPSGREGSLGRLGPYEIVELIARGGMGIVFKALEPALNRIVAVKVLAPELAADSQARERFLREAQAAAAVIHDNVIVIHGVSTAQGLPYLVMPYIPGPTLGGRIEQSGPLSARDIVKVGLQLARGLEAAHAKGLIHRDIKPANILLEGGLERLRISDFGLAHAVEDSALARSGFIAGTPAYMSPEQAEGRSVDTRSDLFSLGCVLYELAAGEPPFPGDSLAAIVQKLRDDEPLPLDRKRPDLPPDLCRVVEKLLRKAPDRRYTSAAGLREAFERLAEAFRGQAAGIGGMHRRLWVAAAAIAGFGTALAVFQTLRPPTAPVETAAAPPPPPFAIARTGEAFSTLKEAVAHCGPSERIVVGPGEFRTPALDLSGKAIEIVAAAGASPALILEGEVATIRSDSPLVIDGLTIHQEPSFPSEEAGAGLRRGVRVKGARKTGPSGRPRLPPILHSEGAPLRLVRCRLFRLDPLRRILSEGSVIAMENSPRLEVRDSELYSLDRISIAIQFTSTELGGEKEGAETPNARVELVNSLLVCGGAVKVASASASPVEIKLDRSICVTRCLLLIERDLPQAELRFTVDRTVFDCDHILYGANLPSEEYPRRMRWTAREAVYSLRSTFIRAHIDVPTLERLPVPAILEEWQTLWGGGEEGSRRARLKFRDMFFEPGSLNREPRQASFKLDADLEAAGIGPRWPIGPEGGSGVAAEGDAPKKVQAF